MPTLGQGPDASQPRRRRSARPPARPVAGTDSQPCFLRPDACPTGRGTSELQRLTAQQAAAPPSPRGDRVADGRGKMAARPGRLLRARLPARTAPASFFRLGTARQGSWARVGSGPAGVATLGGVFERFTDRPRPVVVSAHDEARTLKHDYIGTEHVLLGLLGEEVGLAARVLESLDITIEEVRAQVARVVGQGDEVTTGQIPFTRARRGCSSWRGARRCRWVTSTSGRSTSCSGSCARTTASPHASCSTSMPTRRRSVARRSASSPAEREWRRGGWRWQRFALGVHDGAHHSTPSPPRGSTNARRDHPIDTRPSKCPACGTWVGSPASLRRGITPPPTTRTRLTAHTALSMPCSLC